MIPKVFNTLFLVSVFTCYSLPGNASWASPRVTQRIVDTGQDRCFGNNGEIACPRPGQPFYGQDAQFAGAAPAYRDNGDGTITDFNTGLMWSKGLSGHKVTPEEGVTLAAKMTLAGYADWRVPTIKELYTLIDFRGSTGSHRRGNFNSVPSNAIPYINTDYFDFAFGNTTGGERFIDAQWLSSTKYVATTMGDNMETVFGVNFADGRIKGYGYKKRGEERVVKTFYIRYVRGRAYGDNDFVDNGDGTIIDRSTGLMWTKADSGKAMDWGSALAYAEKLNTGGHNDWRLPNAKELQYIVDYSRSPDTTGSPAIDPVFPTTSITNEANQKDYPFSWTSTTHLDGPQKGANAIYVAFGRAIGQWRGRVVDVHGAGAQRSDPKIGRGGLGHGAQGDARRVLNYVRCVRGGAATGTVTGRNGQSSYPNKIRLAEIEHEPVKFKRGEGGAADQRPGQQFGQQSGGGQQLGFDQQSGRQGGQQFGQQPGYDQQAGRQGGQQFGQQSAGPSPPGGGDFVARLDRDRDNRVSRQEFDGPPDRFDYHDANHDGYLTADEAPQGPPPQGRQGNARF